MAEPAGQRGRATANQRRDCHARAGGRRADGNAGVASTRRYRDELRQVGRFTVPSGCRQRRPQIQHVAVVFRKVCNDIQPDAGNVVTSDQSTRLALWIDAARLHRALAAWLSKAPRHDLAFSPGVDWTKDPARLLLRLISQFVDELRDPTGLTTSPIARETFTDLLLQTILNRLDHNHAGRIGGLRSSAVPGYLRRAEAFMRAAADRPITLTDVSAAAGCSLGTLQTVFRRYRETTPLTALHDVRLQHVRQALLESPDDEPTRTIARRFGFTNPSCFIAAYGERFGEHTTETRRRRSW